MARTENRFIRIEDWKGNVYFPDSSESSTAGVISGEASTEEGADPYTQGEYIPDIKANKQKAIKIDHSEERIIYKGSFLKIPFGDVIVGIRMKLGRELDQSLSDETNIANVKFYFRNLDTSEDTLLEEYNIKAKDLELDYLTLPYIINWKVPNGTDAFSNSALVIDLRKRSTSGVSVRLDFDQMYVTLFAGKKASGSGNNVSIQNRTIVVS